MLRDAIADLQSDRTELLEARAKLKRFERGDFTADEIHNFCNNLSDTVSKAEFEAGCRAYVLKLYAKDENCAGRGQCHGALQWCGDCGDVSNMCNEAGVCAAHPNYHAPGRVRPLPGYDDD